MKSAIRYGQAYLRVKVLKNWILTSIGTDFDEGILERLLWEKILPILCSCGELIRHPEDIWWGAEKTSLPLCLGCLADKRRDTVR